MYARHHRRSKNKKCNTTKTSLSIFWKKNRKKKKMLQLFPFWKCAVRTTPSPDGEGAMLKLKMICQCALNLKTSHQKNAKAVDGKFRRKQP